MKRTFLALSATAVLLAVSGCAGVQEAAQDARTAASDAASKVAGMSGEQIKNQVCDLLKDGAVSMTDKNLLSGLVGGAEAAGLPEEFLDPMRRIAAAGDQAPEESVKALNDACAK